jgi:GTP-dependent dephospho-CoA kinase
MPRAGTRSASSDERAWAVPESLRPTLAERYGPVFAGAEADRRIRALGVFATCGDRVTARAIELGHPPLVGIVDYKTRRDEPIPRGIFEPLAARRRVRVTNPPGYLTEELRSAVRSTIAAGGGLIEVDGEEDLGSLALVESMPNGSIVLYGIPGEGVTFVLADAIAKEHVRLIIGQLEMRRLPRPGPTAD